MTSSPSNGWHPADIRAAVEKKGKTLADLARDRGLPESACRYALRHKSLTAELVIAEFLDIPPHILWPDRWLPDGTRIDLRSTPETTNVRLQSTRQKRRAA